MRPEQDEFRRRAVRAALIVVGIAVGIGLLIGGLTTAAITGTDVLPEPTASATPTPYETAPEPEESPSLVETPSPSPTPTTSAPASPSPTTASPTTASPTTTTPTPSPTPREPIRLTASAATADSYEQVTLSGTYAGGNGSTLQVQRLEGGSWTAFPTTAFVEDGSFSTFVQLGQPGPNRLRVVDPAGGQTSDVVVVVIS